MRRRNPAAPAPGQVARTLLRSAALLALALLAGVNAITPALAQSAASHRGDLQIIEKPLKYQNPTSDTDYAPDTARVPQRQWIVYSDREGNPTYADINRTKILRKLQFLDQFYVVEEQGEFVHIVKDPAPSGLTLSGRYEDFGWIHKRNLILWDYCLVASETNTPMKVMIVNTLRHLHQNGKGNGELVEFRRSPDTNATIAAAGSRLFQFYFLMKSAADWALVSTAQYIGNRDSSVRIDTLIAGWIPWARLVGWYSKVAVEPNWDSAACAERAKGKRAMVFVNEQAALQYRNGEEPPDEVVWWNADSLEKRPHGEWRRFPVLRGSTSSPGVIEVMANGSMPATREIAIEAFLTLRTKSQQHPLFRKVVLLSSAELYDHVNKMQDLLDSREGREALVTTWLNLAKGVKATVNVGDLLDQTLATLNERIFGLSGGDSFSVRTRLADLFNTTLVSDADLERYLDALKQKMIGLRRIADTQEGNYKYMFRSNGVAYYWIGEDSLP